MAEYGLSENGLKIATFDEIKASLESKLSEDLGGVDFELPSVLGVFSNVMSEEIAILWEELQKLYNSFFIDTATGTSLDYVVAGNLLSRLKPTYTKVTCQLTGDNYTIIPQGTEVRVRNSDITFVLDRNLTLSNSNCYSILIAIKEVKVAAYSVTINNVVYTYNSSSSDTELAIVTGLQNLINASTAVTATLVGSELKITTVEVLTPFSCFISDDLTIQDVTNNANFTCGQLGKIAAPAFSLTEIQTPVRGFLSVTNVTSGETGRDLETDVELRTRQRLSFSIAGSGTDPAIEARLLQVSGVTAAKVTSDRELHTINALVLGGTDEDVATVLQKTRPAGIKLVGNTEVVIVEEGLSYPILFTRPTKIWVTAQVTLTTNESFKEQSAEIIKTKIINYINAIGVANEVTYQALFGFVYSVSGVTNAVILIGGSTNEATVPSLFAANIEIESGQMPITNENKVTINVV